MLNLEQKYFTDSWTANTMKLFLAIEGYFSGLFFCEQVAAKGNSPETNVINVATCSFAHH